VTACNSGVWNEAGASLDFSVAPAYYQTLWFRLLCVACFLGLLWSAYQLHLHTVEQRAQQLALLNEKLQAEAALSKAQEELARANRVMLVGETAASIAHEVTQPTAATITNAGVCLRWLAAEPPDVEEARQAVGRILKDGKRARLLRGFAASSRSLLRRRNDWTSTKQGCVPDGDRRSQT
jgi:C4-dicarboxylate-specific signal transduction histidine kinase